MSRKDWYLTPMSSFDIGQGGVSSGPGGRRVLELVQTDGPGFSLCATLLESSGPGFISMEQRSGEQVEVQWYTRPEMTERTLRVTLRVKGGDKVVELLRVEVANEFGT